MNTAAAYQKLLTELPSFHGSENAVNWKLENAVLLWLRDNIRQDAYTLETGCGYSTVLFAAGGSHHIVVSPTPKEHERIRQWCEEAGITTKTIHFIAGSSDKVLPSLSHQGQLDLVLIDGCHAFPYPVID